MLFEIIGLLLGSIIQGVMITIYGNIFSCPNATISSNFTTQAMTTTQKSYSTLVNKSYFKAFSEFTKKNL